MFTKLITCIVLVATSAGAVIFGFQEERRQIQKDTSPFMKRKLDDSRDIVSGLATEDYGLISKSAQDLMLLSHEADWNVLQTDKYLRMSSDFRSSAQRLRDSAHEKNLDGATLSFFEVTLSCVRCHKYVRQNRDLKKK